MKKLNIDCSQKKIEFSIGEKYESFFDLGIKIIYYSYTSFWSFEGEK